MKLKKYTADSLRAALRLARIELGADATLVDSKEGEEDGRPRFEATFAIEAEGAGRLGDNRLTDGRHWRSFVPPELGAEESSKAVALGSEPSYAPALVVDSGGAAAAPARALEQVAAAISAGVEERPAERAPVMESAPLRESDPSLKAIFIQLRALQSAVDGLRKSDRPALAPPPSLIERTLRPLTDAGFDLETWPQIREKLEREADKGSDALELATWLREQVSAAWNTDAGLQGAPDAAAVGAFVGPSGAGKTSVALKLAVQQGLRCQRTVHLVLADPVRWGSAEALGAQAESAGALLTVARGPEDLVRRMARIRETTPADGLILIDTPSYAPSETVRAEDLAAALDEVGGVETHLTLSAAVGDAEVRRAAERASVFAPSRLIYTHLDLVSRPGVIWNESSRSGLPISFLGTGPKMPEDLRTAHSGRLTNLLFSR